jgi:hypothetical protein
LGLGVEGIGSHEVVTQMKGGEKKITSNNNDRVDCDGGSRNSEGILQTFLEVAGFYTFLVVDPRVTSSNKQRQYLVFQRY